ncbi:MAG: hypothetical protein EOM52_12470 [Clostridia bacterium]|nr:hypothetical protein [Clostridia bacterium]
MSAILLLLPLLPGMGAGEAAPPPPAVFTVTEPGGTTFEYRLALLRDTRAIVSELPGTTRDTIGEEAQFGGVPVRLVAARSLGPTCMPHARP